MLSGSGLKVPKLCGVAFFILLFLSTTLQAGLLQGVGVYRITVAFAENKEVETLFNPKKQTLSLVVKETMVKEVSQVVFDDEGNRDIVTKFEPYSDAGYELIKSCSVLQDAEENSVRVKYTFRKDRKVKYSIVKKDRPFRLVIDFWEAKSK